MIHIIKKKKLFVANCTNGEITLASGPSNREGRVEVCVDGHWGTVCGEGWGDTEAGLVCARLGFPREGEYKRTITHYIVYYTNRTEKEVVCLQVL